MTAVAQNPWLGELSPSRQYRMLIDGEFVEGESGDTFECQYPFDGESWGHVPLATAGDVNRAVGAAARAFSGWSRAAPRERRALLHRLANLVDADADTLAMLQVHENGKLLTEMRPVVSYIAELTQFMAGLAETVHGSTSQSNLADMVSYTVREPLGVVAAITPWNSPLLLLAYKLMPALAAGNTVVVKPSEITPNSTLRLGELCAEAGFPPGVVNIVTGPADPTGSALVRHPLVAHIAFTGSTRTGQAIAQVAAARSARVSLELGGKSPNIVFSDADLDRAVDGVITGIFGAAGQSCTAGSRILVQESISDEFLARLCEKAGLLRLGDPLDPATQVPPLASQAQLAKVLGYLDIARDDGAAAAVGGRRPTEPRLRAGFFVEPTVLTGSSNDDRIAREEVFGPVGAFMTFEDEAAAISLANDTDFGLGGAIWTESVRRAHRLIPQIAAGTVWVNTYRALEYRRPFGGFKQSGIGRELGADALDEYTQTKSVFINTATGSDG